MIKKIFEELCWILIVRIPFFLMFLLIPVPMVIVILFVALIKVLSVRRPQNAKAITLMFIEIIQSELKELHNEISKED